MTILYEDNHLIIVNKTTSEIVQGDKTGDQPLSETIKNYLKIKYNKPGNVFVGVVHRLDRPVSGIVVFAKTSKALARMNELFKGHDVKKTYWAIVKKGSFEPKATLQHYLVRNEQLNKTFAYDREQKNSQLAILHYEMKATSDRYALLEIDLETGRHHQIRCQLAKINAPIKGDLKYGYPRSNEDGGISLHARSISFIHPVSKMPLYVEAPVPSEKLWLYFEQQWNDLQRSI